MIAHEHPGFTQEWRYYNDGKSWLMKVQRKKNTVFWLAILEGSFRTTFYIHEKAKPMVEGSTISDELKQQSAWLRAVAPRTSSTIDSAPCTRFSTTPTCPIWKVHSSTTCSSSWKHALTGRPRSGHRSNHGPQSGNRLAHLASAPQTERPLRKGPSAASN